MRKIIIFLITLTIIFSILFFVLQNYLDINKVLKRLGDETGINITLQNNLTQTSGDLPKIGEQAKGFNLIGKDLYEKLENISIELYNKANEYCLSKGIILADTKFEFGFVDNNITLIDEVLTPDSSRFWKLSDYKIGSSPEPFDKQFLRNWLSNQNWDKTPPPPNLPNEVIKNTLKRYLDIYEVITGDKLK